MSNTENINGSSSSQDSLFDELYEKLNNSLQSVKRDKIMNFIRFNKRNIFYERLKKSLKKKPSEIKVIHI